MQHQWQTYSLSFCKIWEILCQNILFCCPQKVSLIYFYCQKPGNWSNFSFSAQGILWKKSWNHFDRILIWIIGLEFCIGRSFELPAIPAKLVQRPWFYICLWNESNCLYLCTSPEREFGGRRRTGRQITGGWNLQSWGNRNYPANVWSYHDQLCLEPFFPFSTRAQLNWCHLMTKLWNRWFWAEIQGLEIPKAESFHANIWSAGFSSQWRKC